MKTFIRVMKALSDPSRVKILKMLECRGLCVCEITAVLGLAQSTVSKHLKILEDAGFIESWKTGTWVNYKIADQCENPYAETLQTALQNWLEDDSKITELLEKVRQVDRQTLCSR